MTENREGTVDCALVCNEASGSSRPSQMSAAPITRNTVDKGFAQYLGHNKY